jgi:hypothetical protein
MLFNALNMEGRGKVLALQVRSQIKFGSIINVPPFLVAITHCVLLTKACALNHLVLVAITHMLLLDKLK